MNRLRNEIRRYVREIENVLKHPKTTEEVTRCIEEFYKITFGHKPTIQTKFKDICFVREVFLSEFYPTILHVLIQTLKVEWFSNPDHKRLSEVFDKSFTDGDAAGAFTVLIRSVDNLE